MCSEQAEKTAILQYEACNYTHMPPHMPKLSEAFETTHMQSKASKFENMFQRFLKQQEGKVTKFKGRSIHFQGVNVFP